MEGHNLEFKSKHLESRIRVRTPLLPVPHPWFARPGAQDVSLTVQRPIDTQTRPGSGRSRAVHPLVPVRRSGQPRTRHLLIPRPGPRRRKALRPRKEESRAQALPQPPLGVLAAAGRGRWRRPGGEPCYAGVGDGEASAPRVRDPGPRELLVPCLRQAAPLGIGSEPP